MRCPCCGADADRQWHLDNKIYWCRMCAALSRRFTPFPIEMFAPFDTVAHALAIQSEMLAQLDGVYNNARSHWIN